MLLSDQIYICQSAANAIISQVGQPLRMSSDALQGVNQFLDEFLLLILLQLNNSFETARIKQACFQLLPNMLGKNALVEADLQVKGQLDEYHFTHVDVILPILRSKCIQQCTLSSGAKATEHNDTIPNWVIIYITAMLEHIGEHVLNCVANVTEKTGHVSVRDVYFALKEDAQLALLFSRMNLHDKIQKRIGISFPLINNRPRSCYLPQTKERYTTKRNSVVEISFDDLEMEYYDQDENDNQKQIPSYIEPIKYSTRKFKPPSRVQSVYAPDIPKTNFEDLIKSNNTVKVSLTPNRLKSIESNNFEEKAESFISRSRRSTLASLKRMASTVKRPISVPVEKKKEKETDAAIRPISSPPIDDPTPKPRTRTRSQTPSQRSTTLSSPRDSHMSIPSLSETSKSHYSTSSLASTISNTSIGKELSTIGEEEKKSLNRKKIVVEEIIPFQSQESITQILANNNNSNNSLQSQEKLPSTQPVRPSSIVARRAHRMGNTRPKSYHESQATQRYAEMLPIQEDVRHTFQQLRQSNMVLDKVLKFEMASASSRKTTRAVDQAVQTDPVESDDEEWFIQDDELEEQDEADIVNWLLGE